MTNQPIEWKGDRLVILDQTSLPGEEIYLEMTDYRDVAAAIRGLKVRGAPAIGIAGAYAVALGTRAISTINRKTFTGKLNAIIDAIAATRPTARNLFFALERMHRAVDGVKTVSGMKDALTEEAVRIHAEEADATVHLSLFGAELVQDGWTILTHCNAGPLATSGYGTALGVIIMAHTQGKKVDVYADETRPLLQGARLTTWELQKAGIPVTLITDNMAGHFMKQGTIDCVITGADRIAANGDSANKIGTYSVAVLARENGIPFYIAAPASTFDVSLKSGSEITIEERDPEEVTHFHGTRTAPEGTAVANPAFDVTPARYITGIITEKGIIRPSYTTNIRKTLR
ncbi:MAG: S-methyl-5-thioribose-1-phosphate isomerase [Dehalococcoidales bacterium]|nr:S-methyl-5-thioribose-1-phosphate isomerase [Dehalococcoidales bacterium]